MREAYAHESVVQMLDGDERAPGAAITVALCGHWDHEPPCPLAPHHTGTSSIGSPHEHSIHVRTLFAVEPAQASEVRGLIEAALRQGELTGPDGVVTQWRLVSSESSAVTPAEADHAQRLVSS